jgi:nicotinamidase-related amidase
MKTLLELSGVQRPEVKLEDSVLVIIDAQQEYESGKLPLPDLKAAITTIKYLLNRARETGTPIIHILHKGSEGGLFDPKTSAFKSIAALEPGLGERVITKKLPDSFANTTLARELGKIGKDKTLILTGFMTHMCISATAMSALNLGFQSVVIEDAVATRDLTSPSGEIIPAHQVNQVALTTLRDRITWVIKSDLLR